VPKSTKADAAPSITQQMNELSELVEQLEDPEIELEAALVLYEKGVKLSGSIQKTLESAEQRVAQVAADGSLLEESDSADDA
jgi:exodeoxyribonuclease VII small subunit